MDTAVIAGRTGKKLPPRAGIRHQVDRENLFDPGHCVAAGAEEQVSRKPHLRARVLQRVHLLSEVDEDVGCRSAGGQGEAHALVHLIPARI